MRKYPKHTVSNNVTIASEEIKLDCSDTTAYEVIPDKNFVRLFEFLHLSEVIHMTSNFFIPVDHKR